MSEFDGLTKFDGISVDNDGVIRVPYAGVYCICGQIDRQLSGKEWVFFPHVRYTLRANELICIATWLNQLNGVTFDASMLA